MVTNKKAKTILVYGDSYTFGKIPGGARYDSETRFTGVLQKTLGDAYEVIEEGLRGRTLDGENKFFPYRNGFPQFGPIFGSHLPIDLVIFFLGTNDTNSGSGKTAEEIVKSNDKYLERVEWWCDHLGFAKPKIMLIAPPAINEKESYKAFENVFKGSESTSRRLSKLMEKFARSEDFLFLDASEIVKVSIVDGVHLDEEANKLLGQAIAEKINI